MTAYSPASFYIDGRWIEPRDADTFVVINPATEQPTATVSMAGVTHVDMAVKAARSAFPTFAVTTRQERVALLERICACYERRREELAQAVTTEMGAPITMSRERHVEAGLTHLRTALAVLKDYEFDIRIGRSLVHREAAGVCGFITPWNWPLNQIACKVGPALAAGCTIVLKPSEYAPLSAMVFADILHEAGVPAGVFNLVNGDGPVAGAALSSHPEIDLISFTGSTRAGIAVAQNAAPTIKRVHQELGGKSPAIVLQDGDLEAAVTHCVRFCFNNSGQSCNAPTRLIVPRSRMDEAERIAASIADEMQLGDPRNAGTSMGPLVNKRQYEAVRGMIERGIEEGAKLVSGGTKLPLHLPQGYFVAPTVFSDGTRDMSIVRDEIFGPVVTILGYDNEEEAIDIGNDTVYGLSAFVWSANRERAAGAGRRLRVGMVHINGARADPEAPFGGVKQSGNGRERGRFGIDEFTELKSVFDN